jgi:hypothetical protein
MLSQHVCIDCINEWVLDDVLSRMDWGSRDDEAWQRGKVFCILAGPNRGLEEYLYPTHSIPKGCRYALEHVVETQTC